MKPKIQLPDWASKLQKKIRYKVLYGGRGSAKSYTIARMLLLEGVGKKIRVLCAREFQNSIAESVHFLLKQEIEILGLNHFYTVTNNSIVGANGSEFIFKGVRTNVDSIKSMAGLTHIWLEEAHTISQISWDVLIPTLREPESEIWVSFNPNSEDDPTYVMFIDKNGKPRVRDDAVILNVNWQDNPWFPEVLVKEKDYLYSVNPDLADHVWGGQCRTHSDAQIFKNKWEVRAFEVTKELGRPYYGSDWGFSTDPTTLVRVFLDWQEKIIYIRNAKFGYHVELDDLPEMFSQVPNSKLFPIRADNSRPETINHICKKGYNVIGAEKWSGSVEDGIDWLKSWKKIVIHPECTDMIKEAKNYSYKVDRLTNDVLTDVVDAYNHGWDAVRYALQPLIQSGSVSTFDVL